MGWVGWGGVVEQVGALVSGAYPQCKPLVFAESTQDGEHGENDGHEAHRAHHVRGHEVQLRTEHLADRNTRYMLDLDLSGCYSYGGEAT